MNDLRLFCLIAVFMFLLLVLLRLGNVCLRGIMMGTPKKFVQDSPSPFADSRSFFRFLFSENLNAYIGAGLVLVAD